MRAVFRLVLTCFVGGRVSRWLSVGGAVLLAISMARLLYLRIQSSSPPWLLAQDAIFLQLLPLGLLALFLGSRHLPLIVSHLARSRTIHMLPFGRLKMLTGAALVTAGVSTMAGLVVVSLYAGLPVDSWLVFKRTVCVMFLTFSVAYLILWRIGRARSTIGILSGAMLVIVALALPIRFIANPARSLHGPVIGGVVLWITLIAAVLLTPRLRAAVSVVRLRVVQRLSRVAVMRSDPAGREIDLLIGVASPWLLALGQIIPILIATRFINQPSIWLFYFALFAAIAGAVTSAAAVRSRSLWLRTPSSRVELFALVEAAFWRHHSYVLGVLLLLLVAIGVHESFAPSMLAFGATLLVLAVFASTNLGLMMTRGIGWRESILAIVTMALLMGTAVAAAAKPIDTVVVASLQMILAVLGLAFRFAAQRRWADLDWTECRPERDANARQAA